MADFASSAAVCSPFFVGSLFRESAADVIADCQVVIDVQTPLAQVSVAEAVVVVVVVEPPPLEPQPAASDRQRSHGDEEEKRTRHPVHPTPEATPNCPT